MERKLWRNRFFFFSYCPLPLSQAVSLVTAQDEKGRLEVLLAKLSWGGGAPQASSLNCTYSSMGGGQKDTQFK